MVTPAEARRLLGAARGPGRPSARCAGGAARLVRPQAGRPRPSQRHVEAEQELGKGLAVAPDDYRILGVLARLEASRHRWSRAIDYGERAIASALESGDPRTGGRCLCCSEGQRQGWSPSTPWRWPCSGNRGSFTVPGACSCSITAGKFPGCSRQSRMRSGLAMTSTATTCWPGPFTRRATIARRGRRHGQRAVSRHPGRHAFLP